MNAAFGFMRDRYPAWYFFGECLPYMASPVQRLSDVIFGGNIKYAKSVALTDCG